VDNTLQQLPSDGYNGCMDEHNNTGGSVPNGSEPVPHGSERAAHITGSVPNRSEPVRNKSSFRSERVPNDSGDDQNSLDLPFGTVPNTGKIVRNDSEPFGTSSERVPNESPQRSEQFGTRSEQEQVSEPERFRTAPACSDSHEGFSITIREAARIFEEAGVPRTERAITKWCNMNARGVTRLDCCYNEAERKYFITPESIERATVEERKKFQYTEYRDGGALSGAVEDLSEQIRGEREESSEHVRNAQTAQIDPKADDTKQGTEQEPHTNRSERVDEPVDEPPHKREEEPESADHRSELKKLQMENYELRVQLEGQKYLVMKFDDLVAGERERHQQEKIALVDRLTDARHQIGTLEQKLLQLEAPHGAVRDAETAEAAAKDQQNEQPQGEHWQRVPQGN
jgi:hypothetical protein